MVQKIIFLLFMVEDNKTQKINTKDLLDSHYFSKKQKTFDILKAQFYATQSVFNKRKIPFRSFVIKKEMKKHLVSCLLFYVRDNYVRKSTWYQSI